MMASSIDSFARRAHRCRKALLVVFLCAGLLTCGPWAVSGSYAAHEDRIERRREEMAMPDEVLDPAWDRFDSDTEAAPGADEGLAPGEGGSVETDILERELQAEIEVLTREGGLEAAPDDDLESDHWDHDEERFDWPETLDEESGQDPVEW